MYIIGPTAEVTRDWFIMCKQSRPPFWSVGLLYLIPYFLYVY